MLNKEPENIASVEEWVPIRGEWGWFPTVHGELRLGQIEKISERGIIQFRLAGTNCLFNYMSDTKPERFQGVLPTENIKDQE